MFWCLSLDKLEISPITPNYVDTAIHLIRLRYHTIIRQYNSSYPYYWRRGPIIARGDNTLYNLIPTSDKNTKFFGKQAI